MVLVFTTVLLTNPAFGEGDPNMVGGGDGIWDDDSTGCVWLRFDAARITVVSLSNPHSNYKPPINLYAGDVQPNVKNFGNHSKQDYKYQGVGLAYGDSFNRWYQKDDLPVMMIGGLRGGYSINNIRLYFTRVSVVNYLADKFGMTYGELTGGEYKLLVEPMAQMEINNSTDVVYICTATEAVMHTGLSKNYSLSTIVYRNLPFGLLCEEPEMELGIDGNNHMGLNMTTTLPRTQAGRDVIFHNLGAGVITYAPPPPHTWFTHDGTYKGSGDNIELWYNKGIEVITGLELNTDRDITHENEDYINFDFNNGLSDKSMASVVVPKGVPRASGGDPQYIHDTLELPFDNFILANGANIDKPVINNAIISLIPQTRLDIEKQAL
jgi:hypothetical protein